MSLDDTTAPQHPGTPGVLAVVLVSASWAGPSRPAPTVLRELGRRWGGAVRTLLLEDPADEILDLLRVDVLPTWLGLVPVPAPSPSIDREGVAASTGDEAARAESERAESERAESGCAEATCAEVGHVEVKRVEHPLLKDEGVLVTDLLGEAAEGGPSMLEGHWRIIRRRVGAMPKHRVDEDFGPGAH